MRYSLPISFFIILLVSSCQIADENAPRPEETFIRYYGDLTQYTAKDIEVVYDAAGVAEGLVVFGTKTTQAGDDDYFVLRTDLDGNFLDSASFGFVNQQQRDFTGDSIPDALRGNEIAGQIEVIPPGFFNFFPEGGFLTIGTSSISAQTIDNFEINDWRILSFGFLDPDLNLVGDSLFAFIAQEDNFELALEGNDIILLQDGSILFVGAKEFDRGGEIDFDNYFLKFSFTQGIVFENVQGPQGAGNDDKVIRAFEKPSGNIVLIGYTNAPSQRGENNGNNGTNANYLELDPNGTPVNYAAYGLDDTRGVVFNDVVSNAIKTSFGYAITGTSTTSNNEQFAFLMNLSNNGVYLSANSHDSSTFNTENNTLFTIGNGVTETQDGNLVLVGQYPAFVIDGQSRGGEGMFVKFDAGAQPVTDAESFMGLASGNDNLIDAVTLPDGRIAAVANVEFGGGVRLISIIKLNNNGSLD